jgi:hypothetical protein
MEAKLVYRAAEPVPMEAPNSTVADPTLNLTLPTMVQLLY